MNWSKEEEKGLLKILSVDGMYLGQIEEPTYEMCKAAVMQDVQASDYAKL